MKITINYITVVYIKFLSLHELREHTKAEEEWDELSNTTVQPVVQCEDGVEVL